jgi:hypothetical protein
MLLSPIDTQPVRPAYYSGLEQQDTDPAGCSNWFVLFIWFIWSVWFNETNATNQITVFFC